jgi:hypothetical protein
MYIPFLACITRSTNSPFAWRHLRAGQSKTEMRSENENRVFDVQGGPEVRAVPFYFGMWRRIISRIGDLRC